MSSLIWKGRRAKYNRHVLEALSDGEKTAWEIAKYIVKHDPAHMKGNWYHQAQKVNSNLVRRGGVLDNLVNSCFINRENGKYSLTILGFMYVLHHINYAGWKLSKDKLFSTYWPEFTPMISEVLEENFTQYSPIERLAADVLAEAFRTYPEKPPTWVQKLWEGMSNSSMRRLIEHLTLGKNLEQLSQKEINNWMIEGVCETLKNCFKTPTEESEQLIVLMCKNFQKLPNEDKLMVIQTFKTIIHDALYSKVRKQKNLQKAFIHKVKQIEPHQIVCYIKCPNCHYNGFSINDGFKLLSNLTLQCEKCKKQSTLTQKMFT